MADDAPLLPPSGSREGPGVGTPFRLGGPTEEARALRNNPTPRERVLWYHLQGKRLAGLKFSRQMPIAGYKADFVCRSHKLVVELDGSQHADAADHDARRTERLNAAGYRVVRFWNNDLAANPEGVPETIAAAALESGVVPTPGPLRTREGRRRRGSGNAVP